MNFKYSALIIALTPLLLVGCGGASGSGPAPGPSTTIVALKAQGKSVNNINLTSGYFTAGSYSALSAAAKQKLNDEDNTQSEETITVEYTGDTPALPAASPSSPDISFIASSEKPASCDSGDKCIDMTVVFKPVSTTDNQSASFFDGKLNVSGYVPFRMFRMTKIGEGYINNSAVVSTQSQANFQYQFTSEDVDNNLSFNTKLAPAKVTLGSDDLTASAGGGQLTVPMTLSVGSDSKTITASYQCTASGNDCGAFAGARLLKTYDSTDNTKVTYVPVLPTSSSGTLQNLTVPVSLTLTRAFLVATQQGGAYLLNNTNDTSVRSLDAYTVQDGKAVQKPLVDITGGQAITHIALLPRSSALFGGQTILYPGMPYLSDQATLIAYGIISGDNFTYYLNNEKGVAESGATHIIAQSSFDFSPNDMFGFTATLVGNTSNATTPYVLDVEESDIVGTGDKTKFNVSSDDLPANLTNIHMVSTAILNEDQSSGTANILLSGDLSGKTSFYQATIHITSFDKKPTYTLDKFTLVSTLNHTVSVIPAHYNTYDGSIKWMNPQQQKLAYVDTTNGKKNLNIMSTPVDGKIPANTTWDLSPYINAAKVSAFSCTDTDTSAKLLSNKCYVIFENTSSNSTPNYTAYALQNFDPNLAGAFSASGANVDVITFKDGMTTSLKQALIDGNTGAILTLDANNHLDLYTMALPTDIHEYNNAVSVSLPDSVINGAQTPTNLYLN